jgi:hypothetical protein
MVESVLSYLWLAFSATLIQILILLGPGFLLTLILHFETSFIQNRAVNSLGMGWYLGLFGWLGTIVHELGHALFCIIFGHKITDMKLFHPDPETGTLGYVKHFYNRANIYQLAGNFFIGIGPILLGTAVIFVLAYILLGLNSFSVGSNFSSTSFQINSWDTLKELLQSLWTSSGQLFTGIFSWQHITSWQLYVFIYLVFAIGSSITLSTPDIKAALGGFFVIAGLIFILNLATVWAGNFISNFAIGISGYYVLFYAIIFLLFLVNIVVALVFFLPVSLLRSKPSKTT